MRLPRFITPRWLLAAFGRRREDSDFRRFLREDVIVRSPHRLRIGPGSMIDAGAFLHCGGMPWCRGVGDGIQIGENCYIGPKAQLMGGAGITIGDDVMIAPGVVLTSYGHRFERTDIPMRLQPHVFGEIVVGNDVWIGANAVILPGVRIGEGVVVAAGAVVTRNVPDWSVVAGVPARVVKTRR